MRQFKAPRRVRRGVASLAFGSGRQSSGRTGVITRSGIGECERAVLYAVYRVPCGLQEWLQGAQLIVRDANSMKDEMSGEIEVHCPLYR